MSYNESLNSNSNYPIMSQTEWDNAPFNQKESKEIEVKLEVTFSISKPIRIKTTSYGEGDVDYEYDDEGHKIAYRCPNELYEVEIAKEAKETIEKELQKLVDFCGANGSDYEIMDITEV